MRAMLVLFVVCLVAGCEDKPAGKGGGATTPPKAGSTPKNASELAALLKGKGIKVTINPGRNLDRPDRPCSEFVAESGGAVLVYQCKDESAAEEMVGANGEKAVRVGRLAIVHYDGPANNVLFADIKKVLR